MQLNLSKSVTAPNGKPYEKSDEDKSPATVGWLCANALLDCKSTTEGTGMLKFERAGLAMKLLPANPNELSGGLIELSVDEAKAIKDCIGEHFPAWIVHQLWTVLEGK